MGGNVNVFLRDNNRNFYKMTRWTNTLPSFLDCIGHVENEETHLDEYLESWLGMKEDWDKNRKTSLFELNMTSVYFPSPNRICRSEYGLVFVDYITKTIISYQDYTQIGVVGLAGFKMRYGHDAMKSIFHIAEKGKMSYNPKWFKPLIIKPVNDAKHMVKLLETNDSAIHFLIDNSPWMIEQGMMHDIKFKDLKTKIDIILAQ